MKRLNVSGMTVTRDAYRSIMDDMGAQLIGSIQKNSIVFDNLDFKILANIILQN